MTATSPVGALAHAPAGRPVVLTDLDGTIVHSRRKVPDPAGLRVVEVYDGRDVGFVTEATWRALADLQRLALLVPATARTTRQYRRIAFPETPAVAVVAGGTVILVDDEPDPVWAEATASVIAATGTTAADVAEAMAALPTTEDPRVGDDRFAFVRVAPGADVDPFDAWCSDHGWRVVRQDGRIYALPADLSKASAIPRLTEIVGDAPTMALGDGMMDLEMLSATRHALTPADGPLWRSGWRDGTAIDGTGPPGAEALVHAALQIVSYPRPTPAAPREEPNVG